MECPCPPIGLIDVVGKKWAVCVVTLLGQNGTVRFGGIQKALPRVSPATLSTTLRALEAESLIRRVRTNGDGRAEFAYALTTRGRALNQALIPLTRFLRANPASRLLSIQSGASSIRKLMPGAVPLVSATKPTLTPARLRPSGV